MGYDDLLDWLKNPDHIYVGRNMSFYVPGAVESKWKNPFSVKKYGRDKCLELYREYITGNHELMDNLHELKGKVLGCWCVPFVDVAVKKSHTNDGVVAVCHAQILKELSK